MKADNWCLVAGLALGLAGCTSFGSRPTSSTQLPLSPAPPPVPVYAPTPAPPAFAPVHSAASPMQPVPTMAPPLVAVPTEPPPPTPPAPVARAESASPEEASELVTKEPPPTRPEDPLVELIRCYRENRAADAQSLLQKFDPARREMLQALLPSLARLGEPRAEPPAPADLAALLDQCETLEQRLCPRARLKLERICFCRTIDGFGAYEPLPGDHVFGATGPGELVQVYLELRHFASLARPPYHETVLACTLEVRDGKHKVVWRKDRPARPERSRTPRQDCFLNCHFELPSLPPGEYTVWIQVKDLTGLSDKEAPPHRVAAGTLEFRVGAPSQARSAR